MRFAKFLALVALVAIVVAAQPLAGAPAAKKGAPATHPEVDPDEACRTCHEDLTPKVFQAWYSSAHGMNNVYCFVCHGSIGKDFVKVPKNDRCIGCHAAQIQSLGTPFMKRKDCFSCHPPHALSPHMPEAAAGGE
ncbi:MAG: multiheme c-type cytochrome [Thermoanaerobaculia bacterium]